jgi:hypothetical protein
MQWECSLDANAEGLLAYGERLSHAVTLALDRDTFEDLRAPASAFDHLKVDFEPIAGLKPWHSAQLVAFDRVDDSTHGKKEARTRNRPPRRRIVAL